MSQQPKSPATCRYCGKEFNNARRLKQHMGDMERQIYFALMHGEDLSRFDDMHGIAGRPTKNEASQDE